MRFLQGLPLLLAFAPCACGAPPEATPPRLVVLISLDTFRADALGALSGAESSPTPALDRLVADGVLFEEAVCQIPHTLPSHMSLFTGLYPEAHTVRPGGAPLTATIPVLGELVKEAGYTTSAIVTTEWLDPKWGFDRGFDDYRRLPHRPTYAPRVNSAALERIDAGNESGEPLFLFLHYYDAHSDFSQGSDNKLPYFAPEPLREGLGVSGDGSEFCDDEGNCATSFLIGTDRNRTQVSEEIRARIEGLYRAGARYLAEEIGQLLQGLRDRGMYDEALIVLTADHGEEFREHGRWLHSQTFEETARIPLVIKMPGGEGAGRRIDHVVETVDVLPTLAELLGVEPPARIQGESLLALIAGGERHKRSTFSQNSINAKKYGLRTDDEKVRVDLGQGTVELYDLLADPEERHDLAPEERQRANRLARELRRRLEESRQLAQELTRGGDEEAVTLTDEEKKALEALGYVD